MSRASLVTVSVTDGLAASVFYVLAQVVLDELDTLHAMAPLWSFRAYPAEEHSMGLCVWSYHPSAARMNHRQGGGT